MDFAFSQEQDILRDSARRFVDKECSIDYVKQFVDNKITFTDEMWQKITELGWTAVLIPEEYGGLGLNFVDLAVILEEMGRGPVPAPFITSVVLAGEAIRLAGNPDQKNAYLPKMAMGELKGTLAWAEPGDLDGLSNIMLTARRAENSFILNGTKILVPDADQTDIILCVARAEEGTSLFVVGKEDPGVEINSLSTLDKTTDLCEVVFSNVSVPVEALLGEEGTAGPILRQVLNRVNVAYSMDMVGGGQRVLDMGVEYAKTRVQFGQAIGSFQAIKHKCAELLMEIECSRSIAYYAAWAQEQDEKEATINASGAKVFSCDMYRKATKEVLQILGGIGFSWEHELHIYLKRAKCLGALFGDGTFHRERMAQELGY
jgi:alkylation response protein AidB-like acyl-CoA dehydrogenase